MFSDKKGRIGACIALICIFSIFSLCATGISVAAQAPGESAEPKAESSAKNTEPTAESSAESTESTAEISSDSTGPEEEIYVENEWNYVENSMDVSQGIPETASGRLARIRETGKLTVATEPYFAPQEFIDPALSGQEQYVGADMELARRIARRMDVALEIVPLEFTEVLNATAEGTYDLAISGLAYTPGRAATLELSKGYYYAEEGTGTAILIREADKKIIKDTKDLADKNLVAQAGSLQELMIAQNVTQYHQFQRVTTSQDVYQALLDESADAAAVDRDTARLYLQNNPDCGLYLLPGIYFRLEEQFEGDRIAAPKGEIQLLYFVNGVIDEILESDQYSEWFAQYADYAAELGLS